MSDWFRRQAIQIVRFVNARDGRMFYALPNQFGFAFLGFPLLVLASLLRGPLAAVLWLVAGIYMVVAIAWPFWIMIRASAHRNARLYDSQRKYLLPPEYRNSTSELKGGR